jgi:type I restriction enzyme, S subunit
MSDELSYVGSGNVRSLPLLPGSWVWTTVGEIADVFRGASPRPKGDPRYFGGPIPWIMISDVTRQRGKYLFETREGVTEAGAALSRRLPSGSLILSNSGTVCVPKILATEGCIHDGFVSFNGLESHVSLDFAYWWFENVRGQIINENRQGITQVNLNTSIVRDIQFPLAPREEQHRIVAEIEKQFTRLDAAVAGLKRVQANLKRYRASVLKAACEGRLVPTEAELARKEGRDYGPASELLKSILAERRAKWETDQLQKMLVAGKPPKNDEWKKAYREPKDPDNSVLPRLPQGWSWVSVEQITLAKEGLVTGPFGTLVSKSDHQLTGVPVCGIPNIKERGFAPGNWFYLSENKAKELYRYAILPGDVVVSRSGTVGEACAITENVGPLIMSTNLMRLRPVVEFLSHWLVTNFKGNPVIASQIESLCKGSTRPFLNLEILSQLVIPLPPQAEQKRALESIERSESALHNIGESLRAQTLKADRTWQAILSHGFKGCLVPQDPSDEPASVLLERIRTQVERNRNPKRTNSLTKQTIAGEAI